MVVLESVTGEVDTGVVTRRRKSRQGRPHQYTFVIVDAFAAAIAAMAIYAAREGGLALARQSSVTRNVLTVLMPAMWIVALALHRAYDRSSIEHAAKARGRVVQAALTLIAAMSSACLALHYTALMDQILFGVPVAAVLTVLLRQSTVRWWRARGGEAYLRRAIIVGPVMPLGGLIAAMGRDRTHDVRMVAACLVDGATDEIGRAHV